MKKILLSLAVLSLFLFTSCEITLIEDPDEGIRINNESSYIINEVYVASSYEDNWGADDLGAYVINSYSSKNFVVSTGTYDVKIIDNSNDGLYTPLYPDTFEIYLVPVLEDEFTELKYDGNRLYGSINGNLVELPKKKMDK